MSFATASWNLNSRPPMGGWGWGGGIPSVSNIQNATRLAEPAYYLPTWFIIGYVAPRQVYRRPQDTPNYGLSLMKLHTAQPTSQRPQENNLPSTRSNNCAVFHYDGHFQRIFPQKYGFTLERAPDRVIRFATVPRPSNIRETSSE